jgi:phosphatidylglycerol lysyltransferase
VLELLRRFGWNATSFQVLEPGYRYHFAGEAGCVAYVATPFAWVAAGAPIAALNEQPRVADSFVQAARAAGRGVVFALTEPRFVAGWSGKALRIGEQPVWDPRAWPATLARSRSLREQLRRARAKGVSVRRVEPSELARPELALRCEIERLTERWLNSHSMAPMGFLVRLHLFELLEERRIFVAESRADGSGTETRASLHAILALVPIYGRAGYLVEDLVRGPEAPNGTTELLIDHALRVCAAEGCSFITLGLAPLAGDVATPLRVTRWLGRSLFDFSGLRAFKAKFLPESWLPIYLSYPRDQWALPAIYATLAAFAQGSLMRFGLATLLRGPGIVLRVLTALLVPWTVALACLDARRHFPAPFLQWSWVLFDAGLFVALLTLVRRPSARLAGWLSAVIAADAGLTLLEALVFNVPTSPDAATAVGLALAVGAPALAAVVLRNVWKRMR